MTPSLDISELNLSKQESVFESGLNSGKSGGLCCSSVPAVLRQ